MTFDRPLPRELKTHDALSVWLSRVTRWEVAAGAFTAFVFATAGLSALQVDLAGRYEREAARRYKAGESRAALVCYQRLSSLDPYRPDYRMGQALSLEALGDVSRADALLDRLAPPGKPGHAPAHLRLAKRLLADPSPPPGATVRAEAHLVQFLASRPRSAEANAMLGRVFAATGRFREARPCLEIAAATDPTLLPRLARVCSALDDEEYARFYARQALRLLPVKAPAGGGTEAAAADAETPLLRAEAAQVLDAHAEAVVILAAALARPGGERFRPALARAYAVWYEALKGDRRADVGTRLTTLAEGLGYDPAEPALLAPLLRDLDDFTTGGNAADPSKRRAAPPALSLKGRALGHLALAVAAWEHHEPAAARSHWAEAVRLEPSSRAVLRGLALGLADSQPSRLDRALSLAELALTFDPDDPDARRTRDLVRSRRRGDAPPR